ncbi:class A beta-lactamase [Pontixanthobacter gangjinensis]|nr:class A beta-lactamase [Pontixanthobacter gangjinensis]
MTFDRRTMLASGSALLASTIATGCVPMDTSLPGRLSAHLRIIEAASGGALGAAILDTGSGKILGNRLDERFAHCSSFKLSLAALAMQRSANGGDAFDTLLPITAEDIVSYSPVTKERVGQMMTIADLAKTTLTTSDNAAANILMRQFGGPEAVTAFWRSVGDEISRLDRYETALNFVPPGEVRDTTTPRAMANTVRTILYGATLPSDMQQTLRGWMTETSTGTKRIRAGIPASWKAGDKTGTAFAPGMGSFYVDLAFAEPPEGAPLVIATYLRLTAVHERVEPESEAVLASVGALATRMAPKA